MVTDVREQLDERDTKIGRIALSPVGQKQRHSVENQLAETGIILGQIINLRLDAGLGWADVFRSAVEVRRAFDFEGEIDCSETRIDIVRWNRIVSSSPGLRFKAARVPGPAATTGDVAPAIGRRGPPKLPRSSAIEKSGRGLPVARR